MQYLMVKYDAVCYMMQYDAVQPALKSVQTTC